MPKVYHNYFSVITEVHSHYPYCYISTRTRTKQNLLNEKFTLIKFTEFFVLE